MKKLRLFIFLLFCFPHSYAQRILFNENFDSFPSYYITGWQLLFSGRAPWQVGLPYQVARSLGGPLLVDFGTNQVAGLDSLYDNDSASMYSPFFVISSSDLAYLSYDSYFLKHKNGAIAESATVKISTDSGLTWDILQDVPANTTPNFITYYLDLSAYKNKNKVRLGFQYKQGSGGLAWAVDNINVFVPAHKDIRMIPLYQDSLQSYVTLNQSYIHHARIQNYGLDTLHSFVAKYQQAGGNIYADTITGLNLPAFAMYDFTYSVPDTVTSIGLHKITMWVELTGDTIHSNDTAYNFLRGTYFYPRKRLLIEEGTGTHYYWGPQGWVYMNQIAVPNDTLDVCEVSVHDGDPMTVTDYDNFLLSCNYYPTYFLFDRRVNVGADTFFTTLYKQKNDFGFADLDIDGGINGTSLSVNAHVKPAIDLNGDYRLALVVTEDHVTGTTAAYDQYNNYANNANGPMGGFENKPDPVPAADMYYNFVARKIVPSPDGDPGMLPISMLHNQVYDYSFNTIVDRAWNTSTLRVIVMLINHNDSSVCNSNKLNLYLKSSSLSITVDDAGIYPNPAKDAATLHFTMAQEEPVTIFATDLSGRTVLQFPVNANSGNNEIVLSTGQLSSGIYLVNIQSASFRKSLKLEVIH